MARSLPERPDTGYLSRQAKTLHHAQKRGDPSVTDTLRLLRRFHRASDAEILASEVKLHEVQFALAMDYGFNSWNALKHHAESLRSGIPATINRQNGTVRIENVPRLQWAIGRENTYMASFAAAMQAIGENVDYNFLMGVSGMAFRLHFLLPHGCPSSPDAMVGFDATVPAAEALGYDVSFLHSSKDKADEVEKVRETVIRSIDAGRPVVAIDLIKVPDWGVICGYTNDGKDFLCRTYWDKSYDLSIAEKWPWLTVFIGDKNKTPSKKKTVRRSLEIAVKVATTDKFDNYASGFHAYEAWCAYLKDESHFKSLEISDLMSSTHMNAWIYNSLIDARTASIHYLRSVKDELGPAASNHLSKAADIYEQIVKKLRDNWKYAPFTWLLKEGELWTQEMRQAEADTLKEVSAIEKKALNELSAALQAEQSEN